MESFLDKPYNVEKIAPEEAVKRLEEIKLLYPVIEEFYMHSMEENERLRKENAELQKQVENLKKEIEGIKKHKSRW